MAGPFELATRSAIEEIILDSVQASKFGYVMTQEALQDISDQIFELFMTSRNLKAAGDRMLAQGLAPTVKKPETLSLGKKRTRF